MKRASSLARVHSRPPSVYPCPAPVGAQDDLSSIRVLDSRADLTTPVDWNPPDRPYLWRFNLHYFAYIHKLGDASTSQIIHDWIVNNEIGNEPGWHPYPTSLRIINWIKRGCIDSEFQDSLYQQSAYLADLIETHIGGNHILENARALMHAGCYFEGDARAEVWKEKAYDIYTRELPEQILPDGGHFERSPMYHAIVLEGLLDVIFLLESSEVGSATELIPYAQRMLDFLISVTHPDGHIALFNDSTQEIASSTAELLRYGKDVLQYSPTKRTNFPESGYFVHQDDYAYFIIDGGKIGPDHLPAHAHADIFSYELSCAGHQFVVDTGVFEYAAGDLRNYVRSTEAHNTIQIDDEDQVECWSSFRVARRYDPHGISFKNNNTGFLFTGEYSGWAHLIGDSLRHSRTVCYDHESCELEFRDIVTGRGRHKVRSRIHLHPEVEVVRMDDRLLLKRTNTEVTFVTSCPFEIVDTVYCPEFGIQVANKTILLSDTLDRESVITYRFIF